MVFKNWRLRQGVSSEDDRRFPKFINQLLAGRGYSREALTKFLDAPAPLSDPFLMKDMDLAVESIHRAIADSQRILVFGDFDCDGITATVMLYDYLENCGADVLYYIPERETEGYGLSGDAIRRVKEAEISLMITVDNGISAIQEADLAKELGLEVIITDHHTPREKLPQAAAVLNPHRKDCAYPYKDLCGAAVVFQLICALEGESSELLLEQYGDLVGIGTLADVVPLTGENRILAKAGLAALANTIRPGLLALAEAAGLDLSRQDPEVVTFGIAPRINVTGRIGSVDTAVELLLCEDEERAKELAEEMHRLNNQRKTIEGEILEEIGRQMRQDSGLLHRRVLVLVGENWNRGVVGIVAARIAERYGKPCIILSAVDGEVRGSARSVEGFDIIEAIHACGHLLIKYGGHPMAAGLSLEREKVPEFIEAMLGFAAEQYPAMPGPVLDIDAPIEPEEITLENIRTLQRLAPFGCGNPPPVLALMDQRITGITAMGGGNHLRLTFGSGAETVLFGIGPMAFPFAVGERVDVAVSLSINVYNGQEKPSARVLCLRPAGYDGAAAQRYKDAYDAVKCGEEPMGLTPGELAFDREDLSVVFRFLRGNSPFAFGTDVLAFRLGADSNHFKVLAAVDILRELGLLIEEQAPQGGVLRVLSPEQKTELASSQTFQILQEKVVT